MSSSKANPQSSYETFLKNLQAELDRRRWTNTELSERTGIARPTISRYLNSGVVPSLDQIDLIANAFGRSSAELIAAEPPRPDHWRALEIVRDSLNELEKLRRKK